jgi:hypothetical protein
VVQYPSRWYCSLRTQYYSRGNVHPPPRGSLDRIVPVLQSPSHWYCSLCHRYCSSTAADSLDGTVLVLQYLATGTVHCTVSTVHAVLFIHHRRFSTPCGHHAGRHRGCCPPCLARGGGVQGRCLGVDGYSCPSARVIFIFIVVFPGHGLVARPHRLFDLRRYGRRRTSPSGGCSAQRPPAGEHHPQLLLHQLRQLV